MGFGWLEVRLHYFPARHHQGQTSAGKMKKYLYEL
jgi:hypothetical protein